MKDFFLSLMNIGKKVSLLALAFYASGLIVDVSAATLSMNPAITNLKAGSTATVTVFVNTENTTINGVDGNIVFPTDILEVTSISRNNSIFPMWVEEPSYSNTAGVITFNGGIPNPGYNGSTGKVLTFTVRAKKDGQATVEFSSSNIRANDGLGTNVLTGQQSLEIAVSPTQAVPPKGVVNNTEAPTSNTTPSARDVPNMPVITSATHPSTTAWYKETKALFTWPLGKGITDARLSVTKSPTGKTSVLYTPAVSSKEVATLTDGVWYFNAQLANDAGWSETAHYAVHIDTEKPEYCNVSKVDVIEGDTGVKANLKIEAKDSISGVDHYKVSVDGGTSVTWNGTSGDIYTTSPLTVGAHAVLVQAIDKAGNICDSKIDFTVESKITPPVFDAHEDTVAVGGSIILQGKTYPNAKVEIITEKEGGKTEVNLVTSNNEGIFSYTAKVGKEQSSYKIFARVIDGDGVRSLPSAGALIEVIPKPLSSSHNDSMTTILIALIIALTVAIIVICITVYKLYQIKATIRRETLLAEGKFHRAFNVLRDEIVSQLQAFEKVKSKRDLTKEEIKITKILRLELTKAEELLSEEIEKINDKV